VEDQETNQIIARKFLESAGALVQVAANGREALEHLAQESFDLVLMDCQMPEIDGFEATRRLRDLEKGTGRHLPVIAMTAHAMAGDRDRCLQAGMDDYLTKPVSREPLLRAVARWLSPEAPADVESAAAASSPEPEIGKTKATEPGLDLDEAQFQKLLELFNQDVPEMIGAIVAPYIRQGEEQLRALRQHLDSGDLRGLKFVAHSLKGSSRTIGLGGLGKKAEQLERECDGASPEQLAQCLEEIEAAFAGGCRWLNTLGQPDSLSQS